MEIISYVGTAGVKTGTLPKVRLPKRFFRRKSDYTDDITVKGKKFYPVLFLKKLGSLLWLLPVPVLAVLIPFLADKAVSAYRSRANPLKLEESAGEEMEFLREAMARSALSCGEVDDDGNLAGADVSSILHEKVSFENYTVKAGDTVSGIAKKFGLNNISTVIAVNGIENVRQVYSGQKLIIPSADGLIHTVTAGNSLEGISSKYKVALEDILDANDLDSISLTAGQKLFIPGARLDRETLRKAMGEVWATPLKVKWRLTSKCGWRGDPFTGVRQYHPGIDMSCSTGTPIFAAMGGRVLASGTSRIYGNYIIIDHGNGYQTLYGHMSKRISAAGEYVSQNQKIGLAGSTGYSTGPHLHFTVYKNGRVVDPLTVLKI